MVFNKQDIVRNNTLQMSKTFGLNKTKQTAEKSQRVIKTPEWEFIGGISKCQRNAIRSMSFYGWCKISNLLCSLFVFSLVFFGIIGLGNNVRNTEHKRQHNFCCSFFFHSVIVFTVDLRKKAKMRIIRFVRF